MKTKYMHLMVFINYITPLFKEETFPCLNTVCQSQNLHVVPLNRVVEVTESSQKKHLFFKERNTSAVSRDTFKNIPSLKPTYLLSCLALLKFDGNTFY